MLMDKFMRVLGKKVRRLDLASCLLFLVLVTISAFLISEVHSITNIYYSAVLRVKTSSAESDHTSNYDIDQQIGPYSPGLEIGAGADDSGRQSYLYAPSTITSFVLSATDSSGTQTGANNPSHTRFNSSKPLPGTFFSMDWNHFIPSGTWPSVSFGGIRLWDNYASWQDIEKANGTYNWNNLDKWLVAADASHADVLYAFGRTPAWASLRPSEKCNYGAGCAAPPSDVDSGDNIWKAFVTALVQHSLSSPAAHIKYYEMWNEPDCTKGCTWTGTDVQLVTMARDAYHVIHTLDPDALVLGPSPHGLSVVKWLQAYYAAGGAAYQDIVAFHAYVGSHLDQLPLIVDNTRALMAQYGIGNQPLWVTEGNWGVTGLSSSQQVAYLAQEYIILWSKNVARVYWYSWDGGPQWGQLWTASTGINSAGVAYGLLENWLIGSVSPPSPCQQTGDATWNCTLTLSNGDPAEIIWNPNTSSKEAISPGFTTYRTLDSSAVNSIVGNTISLGNEPILLIASGKH
jgi:hypothetical protein